MRATEPITITLLDNKPRGIRFTYSAMKRINAMQASGDIEMLDILPRVIHEGLVEKDLTVEQIEELIDVRMIGELNEIIRKANETGLPINTTNPPPAQTAS